MSNSKRFSTVNGVPPKVQGTEANSSTARQSTTDLPAPPEAPKGETESGTLALFLIAVLAPLATLFFLWQGFLFLRDGQAPKIVTAIVAIVWGVGGVAAIFAVANWLVEQLTPPLRSRIQPYLFVGPALLLLLWYLAIPAGRTFYLSLYDSNSQHFVGLTNYVDAFTERFMLAAFRNNLLWLIFGAGASVGLGLLIAELADRSSFERVAKSIIFMPLAISMVGASVIWNFIYAVRAPGDPQIGLLNAIVVALGGRPQAWTALLQPWNNLFLIAIMVWLQTGFAMVLFSAAIKGIPAEVLEAARTDGANERQVFQYMIVPMIRGTIVTVSTTIVIFTLKIFDIVIVMTGGQFNTDVIATQFYRQYFTNRNFGLGSAIAIVLLVAVIPVMIYNLRQFRNQEAF
ncbi:MAG: sugar ABC transporter permease [Caldilineaceae bacterium]|nr:sugar ABC transporter permease [Caldilineaceae bacterium]